MAIIENYNSVGDEKTTSPSSGYNSCSSNQAYGTIQKSGSVLGVYVGVGVKTLIHKPGSISKRPQFGFNFLNYMNEYIFFYIYILQKGGGAEVKEVKKFQAWVV